MITAAPSPPSALVSDPFPLVMAQITRDLKKKKAKKKEKENEKPAHRLAFVFGIHSRAPKESCAARHRLI